MPPDPEVVAQRRRVARLEHQLQRAQKGIEVPSYIGGSGNRAEPAARLEGGALMEAVRNAARDLGGIDALFRGDAVDDTSELYRVSRKRLQERCPRSGLQNNRLCNIWRPNCVGPRTSRSAVALRTKALVAGTRSLATTDSVGPYKVPVMLLTGTSAGHGQPGQVGRARAERPRLSAAAYRSIIPYTACAPRAKAARKEAQSSGHTPPRQPENEAAAWENRSRSAAAARPRAPLSRD